MENREIKFRAWHIGQKIMAKVGTLHHDGDIRASWIDAIRYEQEKHSGLFYPGAVSQDWPNGSYILMQYTGLKDKKANRDVFEHDVYFEIDKYEDIERKLVFVMTWINERAAFAMLEVSEYYNYINNGFNAIERDFDGFYFEITQDSIDKMQYAGNIYEHPESCSA